MDKYYLHQNDEIEENEMGRACSKNEGEEYV
jgi:hypothetical protein